VWCFDDGGGLKCCGRAPSLVHLNYSFGGGMAAVAELTGTGISCLRSIYTRQKLEQYHLNSISAISKFHEGYPTIYMYHSMK
jgi:hypothetical protein